MKKQYSKNILPGDSLLATNKVILPLCPSLDIALDGGLRSGQIVEISGPPKLGKTTLALTWGKVAVDKGFRIIYFDVEQRLNSSILNMIGVDLSNITIVKSVQNSMLTADGYLSILKDFIYDNTNLFIIFDSVPALPVEENKIGGISKLLTSTIRNINPIIDINNHFMIWINHEKVAIDGFSKVKKYYTPGGVHLQYQSSTLISIAYKSAINDHNNEKIGHELYVKIKSAPTSKPATIYLRLIFGKGIDVDFDIVNTAKLLGIIKQSGSWYQWQNIKEQGESNFISSLKEKGLLEQVYQQCKEVL